MKLLSLRFKSTLLHATFSCGDYRSSLLCQLGPVRFCQHELLEEVKGFLPAVFQRLPASFCPCEHHPAALLHPGSGGSFPKQQLNSVCDSSKTCRTAIPRYQHQPVGTAFSVVAVPAPHKFLYLNNCNPSLSSLTPRAGGCFL